jgi:hypothetical protein
MGWKRQVRDTASIAYFCIMAVFLVLHGLWPLTLLCAIGVGATALTFGEPHAKFDPSKSGIQKWKQRRRS